MHFYHAFFQSYEWVPYPFVQIVRRSSLPFFVHFEPLGVLMLKAKKLGLIEGFASIKGGEGITHL